MRKQKWKKWVMAAVMAGMLAGQKNILSVQAIEQQGLYEVMNLSRETEVESSEISAEEVFELVQNEEMLTIVTESADAAEKIELLENEEAVTEKTSGITWIVNEETDTVVVTGEGRRGEGTGLQGYDLNRARHIKFENCKIEGGMDFYFYSLSNLESVDLSGLDTSQVTDMSGMFENCSNLIDINMNGLNTSQVTNMSHMFAGCSSLTSLDVSGFDTAQVADMSYMFSGCNGLTSLDVSGFDTAQVADMSYMFSGCNGLTSLDVSGFDTAQVTNMDHMFGGCSSLACLDVSRFNTVQVTDMNQMFSGCSSLTNLDVSGFDTSQVKFMSWMFAECKNITSLDVSGFNTSQVTNMTEMFWRCEGVTNLDVSNFDTSKVKYMGWMFGGCRNLKSIDVSGFDTSQVTDMSGMFWGCSLLTSIDVDDFDTSQVTDMRSMFDGCQNLESINVSSFITTQVVDMAYMFSGCHKLTTLDLSSFNMNNIEYNKTFNRQGSENMLYSWGIQVLKTPYAMCADLIALPATFSAPDGRETDQLTADFCNTTLIRKDADAPVIPNPTPVPTTPPISTPTPVPTPGPVVDEETRDNVKNFVSRMYTVALNRASEPSGQEYWTNRLLGHDTDGAGIAHGFIMSEEFQNRNLTNEEFVDVLYRTFFNREEASEEQAYWLSKLAAGNSRGYVLAGFVNSVEFDMLCDSYSIIRGKMREDGVPYNPGIRPFVERQYTKVLNRAGEKEGIDYWTDEIISGRHTPEDMAKRFFQSEEFANRNLNDSDYVETLYETFLDRPSEPAGKVYWLQQVSNGMDRGAVLEGFSKSSEFAGIVAGYGL